MGDLNPPTSAGWATVGHNQSVRILMVLRGNFSIQVLDRTTRDDAQLETVTGGTGWALPRCVWIIIGSLVSSEHEIMQFKILRAVRKDSSSVQTLDIRKTDFGLSRELSGRIPWEASLKGKGAQETGKSLRTSSSTPTLKKTSRHIRRLAWLTWELVMELQCKKAAYGGGRNIAQECRDGVGKAKAQLELILARDIKGNKEEVRLLL